MSEPDATIVISTKDRKDDLRTALQSAVEQSGNVEILVIDDGSSDGTSDMVRSEFEGVRLVRSERSEGYIVQRSRGAELARGRIVVSVDDDAAFSSASVVSQTLEEFDHPRIGAVAIPFVDVRKGPEVRQLAPSASCRYVAATFIGTAHALRRDVFLNLGGYRQEFVHQGEEADFSIRMLDAGYVVRLGNADPVHHFESPRRSYERMDFYGRRNDILFAWLNAPRAWLPAHLAMTSARGLALGITLRRPRGMAKGLAAGYRDSLLAYASREPVRAETYRLFRRLKKGGPLRLVDVEPLLAPPAFS